MRNKDSKAPKRKNVMAGIALGAEEKQFLKEEADKRGITLSALFKEAIKLYLGFSLDFIGLMQDKAKDHHTSPSFFIERMALAHLAEALKREKKHPTKQTLYWHEGQEPREIPKEKYPDFNKILREQGPEAAAEYIERVNAENN